MRRTPAGRCPQYPRPDPIEPAVDYDAQQQDRPAPRFPIDDYLRFGIRRGPMLNQAEIDQGALERLRDLRMVSGRVRRVERVARNRPANEQRPANDQPPANDQRIPAGPADPQLDQEARERLEGYRNAQPRLVGPAENELDRAARERLDRYRLIGEQEANVNDGAIEDAAAHQPPLTQNRQFWLAMGRQNRAVAWGVLPNPHGIERDLEQELEDSEEAYEAARDEAERDLKGHGR